MPAAIIVKHALIVVQPGALLWRVNKGPIWYTRFIRLLVVVVLILAGCGGYLTIPADELVTQKTIMAPGQSKPDLFKKSKIWLANTYRATRSVIAYESPDQSIIVSNGTLINHLFNNATVTFSSQIEIKDGLVRMIYALENVDNGPAKRRLTQSFGDDINGARSDVAGLMNSMEVFILSGREM